MGEGEELTYQHQTRVSESRPLKYGVENTLAGLTELIHLIKHKQAGGEGEAVKRMVPQSKSFGGELTSSSWMR